MDVMMPLLFYDGKEDGRGWMENLLAAVRDQIPALREGSTAENTLSAGTETAETDTAKQDSFPGPGAERGQTESKEQGTEEDQKDGTQKDETQKDGMEITEPEQTETGITEPAAGESASTAEPEAPQSVPEETIETGGAPREILYPEADTIQETISPDLLADPQALLNRFFVVDPNTSVLPGEIDGSTLLGKDLTLPENAEGPQILIYHTHSQETFADSRPGERADTVIGLGDDLQELLEKQYGYEVLHITEAFDMKEAVSSGAAPTTTRSRSSQRRWKNTRPFSRDRPAPRRGQWFKTSCDRNQRKADRTDHVFQRPFPHERKRRTDKPAQSVSGGKPCIFLSDGV